MTRPTSASNPKYRLVSEDIEGFDSLAELALDMRWSWNHATDELWRQLDPKLWEIRITLGGSSDSLSQPDRTLLR